MAVPQIEDRVEDSVARWLIPLLVAAGFACRVVEAARATIIEHDGAMYAALAAAMLRGDWAHGVSAFWPPLEPLLIAGVAWVARAFGAASGPAELEICARAVSVLAGTALLIPLHALACRVIGPRGAVFALALAAFHPRLARFSGAALTEMPFTLLLVAGVAALANTTVATRARARQAWEAAAGACFGLAWLARPEGMPIALAMWAISWFAPAAAGRARRPSPAFLVVLALVSLPYLLHLHSVTGRWTLGEKGAYNFWREHRAAFVDETPVPPEVGERAFESAELAATPAGAALPVGAWAARHAGAVAARTLRNLGVIVVSSLPGAVVPIVFLLALAGAAMLRWRAGWPVLAPLVLFPLLYAAFTVDRRFFVPVAPFAVVLAARALRGFEDWAARKRGATFGSAAGAGALGAMCGAAIFYLASTPGGIDRAPEHRAAGAWLGAVARANPSDFAFAGRPVVMSRKPWVAYYSGGLVAELPDGDLAAVLERARAKRADVLVIDERWIAATRPALLPLLDPKRAPAGVRVIHRRAGPYPIVLYDVRGLWRD